MLESFKISTLLKYGIGLRALLSESRLSHARPEKQDKCAIIRDLPIVNPCLYLFFIYCKYRVLIDVQFGSMKTQQLIHCSYSKKSCGPLIQYQCNLQINGHKVIDD